MLALTVILPIFGAANVVAATPAVNAPKVNFGPEHKHWREPYDDVYKKLKMNLHKKHHIYMAQPAPIYRGVYLWDSAFISQIWLKANPKIAKDVIRSVLYNQQIDGRVPHVVSLFGTSPWTQPPLLSWAVKNIFEKTGDLAFVAEVYPALVRYHEWLRRERRGPEGLYFWLHPYESGLDNSPRFSDRAEKHFNDTTKQRAVDLTAYAIMDADALAALAEVRKAAVEATNAPQANAPTNAPTDVSAEASANVPAEGAAEVAVEAPAERDAASEYRREASETRELMQKYMWNEQDGQFYDYLADKKTQLKVHTWVTFLALTAGVATPEQAPKLIAHLTNPKEYATEIPFATVQRNSAEFQKDCWRGPVWINTAYLMILGLERYNDHRAARDLAERLVDGVFRTWQIEHTFYEYYDPDAPTLKNLTRKEGNFFKQITLGSKPVSDFVGWTGLVNNLVVDYGLGQN